MLYKIQHACSGGVLHGALDVGLNFETVSIKIQ